MIKLLRVPLLLLAVFFLSSAKIEEDAIQAPAVGKVLVFSIKKEISKAALRDTQKAFEEAMAKEVDYIILHLNTYGGRVDIADSIRTRILNSKIPVFVFIDNQAISAGALISIACDSIYMRVGGSIGAATVVSQSGEVVPDKYQSFMRSTMRATAEAHGKDTVIVGNDTSYVWHRDPKIAEAMVDPVLKIEGIIDSGQVLTLTADEAKEVGYCEGLASSIPEVLELVGIADFEVYYYEPQGVERAIGFLLNPALQGILIILIIGGIYMELQSPGIGLPLGLAVLAAILYFAPLYLEGMAENWEMLVFVAGLVLLALEIFVIPGFGVAGVSGILMIVAGLTLSLVDNVVFEFDSVGGFRMLLMSLLQVVISIFIAAAASIFISNKIGGSRWFSGIALAKVQDHEEGYVSFDQHQKDMIGKVGEAYTVLRPSGKVLIEDEVFDAKAEVGYIEKGDKVKVTRDEAGQLYVLKIQ